MTSGSGVGRRFRWANDQALRHLTRSQAGRLSRSPSLISRESQSKHAGATFLITSATPPAARNAV